MSRTLFIVDGEATAGTIRASGLAKAKELLCWRDALYTGPVPAGLSFRQLSRLRSRFWTRGKSATEFDYRDAALNACKDSESIVLWFAPNCVLCQMSLSQVLSWCREHRVPASRLSWVALHGGELHDSQVAAAYAKCRPVTAAQMSLAVTVWRAFRQPKPADIMKLTRQLPKVIPGLKESLLRLLQEYPSQRNGLSRLEKLLLMTIRSKGSITAAAAASSIFSKETVGDLLLFDMLRDFVRASHPLLEFAEPFSGNIGNRHFHSAVLRLTGFGKRVLAGKADHVTANGIDRWIGGVHLRGQSVRWRWDTIEKRIVSTD